MTTFQKKKINILCFISNGNLSGATKMTLDILKLLDKGSFNIRVVFSKYNYKALIRLNALTELNIKCTILNKILPLWISRYNLGLKLERIIIYFFGKLIIWLKAKAIFFQFKPDIVYSNSVLFSNYNLIPHTRFSKLFYHLHLQENNIHKLIRQVIDNLNDADRVIAISQNQKEQLITKGVNENILSVFHVSICPFEVEQKGSIEEANHYRKLKNYSEDTIIVCYSGGLSYRKGFDLFLEMVSRVIAKENNKIKFLCLGGGDIGDIKGDDVSINVAEYIEKYRNWLDMTGMVINPYIYYNSCDIFVVCSRYEGIPVAMLENMALGKPIIGFDNSGTGEALSGAGILVKDRDVEEMAKQVGRLAGNAEERKYLGMMAKRRIQEDFDLSKNINALENMFISSLN